MSIDVSGVGDLAADFAATAAGARRLVAGEVARTGSQIEATGKMLAPVDTGALRASISTSVIDAGLGVEVGPTVHYGGYNEFGTSRMAPRPYMGPALDRHIPELVERIGPIVSARLSG